MTLMKMAIEAAKASMKHEPHLKPLFIILGCGPILSASIIGWSIFGKSDVKITRFGDHTAWNSVDMTKATQVLFCNKNHKAGYVNDPEVEALRREIYDFESFARRHGHH